ELGVEQEQVNIARRAAADAAVVETGVALEPPGGDVQVGGADGAAAPPGRVADKRGAVHAYPIAAQRSAAAARIGAAVARYQAPEHEQGVDRNRAGASGGRIAEEAGIGQADGESAKRAGVATRLGTAILLEQAIGDQCFVIGVHPPRASARMIADPLRSAEGG